ncbi:MAG: hypothetical protein RL701_974 [Pseudomonadota bacterium]|jgi:cholesterol transport system auxiliary component
MTTRTRNDRYLSTLALCLGLTGCALVSRGDTIQVRYYTLEPAEGPAIASETRSAPVRMDTSDKPLELELRLGRVDASEALNQQIAVRTGENEITYQEEERWTERPAQYVRRGLERELFQKHQVTRVYSGAAATLDVELVDLEIIYDAAPKARVRLLAHLHDHQRGLCNETSAIDAPITLPSDSSKATAVSVTALSNAMQAALKRLSEHVVQCLAAHSQPKTDAAASGSP